MAQVSTGFGFSLAAAPFLVAAYGAPRGVQINLALSVVLNIAVLGREHRHVRAGRVVALLVPAAVTVLALSLVLRGARSPWLTVLAGIVILIGCLLIARGLRLPRAEGRVGAAVAGAVSGAMTIVSGAGGPPVVLYGLNAGWRVVETRPTLQAYFLGLNAVTVLALGLPGSIPVVLPLALAAGLLCGRMLSGRLAESDVRRATLALAGVGGLLAVARGVSRL